MQTLWPAVVITLASIALLLVIPIIFTVLVKINIDKKYTGLTLKLFGFLPLLKLKLFVEDFDLVAEGKRKTTKLPLWDMDFTPPKGLYLIKALSVYKVRTNLNLNPCALTKNNITTYFNVAALFTADGVLKGKGIDSGCAMFVSPQDTAIKADISIRFTILKILIVAINRGVKNGRAKSNTANS